MGNCGCKDQGGDAGQLTVNGKDDPELEKAALRIQSQFRGHQVRKNVKGGNDEDDAKHAPNQNFATLLNSVPNYANANTTATLQRIGNFIYDADDAHDADLPTLGPYELEN